MTGPELGERLRRFWMTTIELGPNEQLVLQGEAVNDHQWHVSYGKLFLTDERVFFQGYYFPLSFAPLGHQHQWSLRDVEAAGESRHAATFFLAKELYLQVRGRIHFFRLGNRMEWLRRLAEAGVRVEG